MLEQAIFQATLDELVASGYARLSMEAVAAGAQTGKAAVYRRWASKEELVLGAMRATLPPFDPVPDTGSLRGDLLVLVERARTVMLSLPGCAIRAIMSELDHERARPFRGLMHENVAEPVKSLTLQILGHGMERGEVRPEALTPLVADVLPALMMYRFKMQGPPTEADTVALVDEVMLPLVRA